MMRYVSLIHSTPFFTRILFSEISYCLITHRNIRSLRNHISIIDKYDFELRKMCIVWKNIIECALAVCNLIIFTIRKGCSIIPHSQILF